ncbi:hypothetical protein K461DRAFT_272285 [Myriangium duriaei CBS 260.36]|uniref:Uncharacterized protein n=1 Tax=Myriangium duriaei CBS 260.36 TaxID=1168546 RepID=A0A9P4ITL9_9PEZI|nr:hypothetical protein K461DRAFT_272285 [Myriangium duriaei CBS 260.36]
MHLRQRRRAFELVHTLESLDLESAGSHMFCTVADAAEPDDNRLLRSEILAPIRLVHDRIKSQYLRTLRPEDSAMHDYDSSEFQTVDEAPPQQSPPGFNWALYPTLVLSISMCHVRILQVHVDLPKGAIIVRKTPYMHIASANDEERIHLVLRWLVGRPVGDTRLRPHPVDGELRHLRRHGFDADKQALGIQFEGNEIANTA